MPMLFNRAVAILSLLPLLGDVPPRARGDDPFRDRVAPFVQNYCVKCHNPKTVEGELNLTRYASAASIARDFRQWEHVVTFLKEEKMPPQEAKQPSEATRGEFLAAIESIFSQEARKLADDPGAAISRRLSNAEYNNTIRDLTGEDIRPASTFPIDPASGEGFNNTGEALTMSPNLFKKYYAAAQQVADHALLTTSGLEFAPFPIVTFSDRQKYYEQAILRFYERHKIDYETYLAAVWTYRRRPDSRRDATLETWAAERKLSPKYLRSLGDALQDETSKDAFYLRWLRQRWNAVPTTGDTTATAIPAETLRHIRLLSADIQRIASQLGTPETEAIVSNAGNAPIQHIDRRKKMAASRDKPSPNLLQPTRRFSAR